MPMKLLRRVRLVAYINRDSLAFFQTQQGPRKLPVISSG